MAHAHSKVPGTEAVVVVTCLTHTYWKEAWAPVENKTLSQGAQPGHRQKSQQTVVIHGHQGCDVGRMGPGTGEEVPDSAWGGWGGNHGTLLGGGDNRGD